MERNKAKALVVKIVIVFVVEVVIIEVLVLFEQAEQEAALLVVLFLVVIVIIVIVLVVDVVYGLGCLAPAAVALGYRVAGLGLRLGRYRLAYGLRRGGSRGCRLLLYACHYVICAHCRL